MKKFLLGLLCASAVSNSIAISISDALADDTDKQTVTQKVESEYELGKKVVEITSSRDLLQGIVRSLRLHLSVEDIKILCEKLPLVVQGFELVKNPDFIKQLQHQGEIVAVVQQKELTEKEQEELEARLQRECPLVVKYFHLSMELQAFHVGLMEGFEAASWDKVFATILKGLQV